MLDSHPSRIGAGHRGSRRSPARPHAVSAGAGRRRVQRERRARAQVGFARRRQHVVRRLAHQCDQLGRVGEVDRLDADVGLGVARAVPVEVVAAGAPAAAVVLADADLEVGRAVGPLDVAEGAPDRQLPAHVGLGLDEVHVLVQGERVQRAAVAALEVAGVVEDAGAADDAGLALALVVGLDPALRLTPPRLFSASARRCQVASSSRSTQSATRFSSALSEKCAPSVQQPASGAVGVDARAAVAEDAGPARGQPGEVAAEHLVGVGGILELDPGAGKDEIDLGHAASLCRAPADGRGR